MTRIGRPSRVLAQRVDEAAQAELCGDVRGGVLVRLPACDAAGEEDVAAVPDVREAEPCDPYRAVDVRVQDGRLVLGVGLPERIAAECQPRVVVEDVDAAELGRGCLDERPAAVLFPHVERQRDVGVDALHAPRSAGDPHAGLTQLAHRRRPDARGSARDDRGLSLQLHRGQPTTSPASGISLREITESAWRIPSAQPPEGVRFAAARH